jgi:hypothetical protein
MPSRSLSRLHAPGGRHPLPTPPLADQGATRLVDWLGDVSTEHVLVFGRGLDLICALLNAGAAEAELRCSHDRLEPHCASLVIVPDLPSTDWLASALPHISRALIPNGRLVLDIGPAAGHQANGIRRQLVLHGFSAIRVGQIGDDLMISAEVPAFHIRHLA